MKDFKEFKKYKWQVLAKDFNSPFFRNYIWTNAPLKFPELFGISSLVIGILSKKNDIEYIGDIDVWTKVHLELKDKALKDYNLVEKIIDRTNVLGESFNQWSEDNIFNIDLSKKTSQELLSLIKIFIEKQSELYAFGILLPVLDFQGFSFVENNLEKFLREKVSPDEYQKYYDIFTEPLNNSFAQDQEESLLKLVEEFVDSEWVENISTKNINEIKSLYPAFFEKLQNHTKKYAWVYYVYSGPAFNEKNFLEFIKDYLNKKINPTLKLKELETHKREVSDLREKYIKELRPDPFNESILRLAGKMIWAKPRRKDYQSKSYFHSEKLFKEIARRLYISLSQARSTPIEVLEKALNGGNLDVNILNSIFNFHICLPREKDVLTLSVEEADYFYNNFVEKEKTVDFGDIKELKGVAAYKGNVTGKVKVINKIEDMEKMKEGDILVSIATTPSIVPAMKKAGAIITDEGGLTCHAAIVSRELGIVCVIGTKIATQVLKDGDMVEVDANKGIVRIIK